MAHSYLDFQGQYVHIRDEQIIWLMESILREASLYRVPAGLNALLEWWTDKRDTFGPGCIELPLDDFLRDKKSTEMLIEILAQIASKSRGAGPLVHGDESIHALAPLQIAACNEAIGPSSDVVNKVTSLIKSGNG